MFYATILLFRFANWTHDLSVTLQTVKGEDVLLELVSVSQ